ncbi:EAL domain-containing protein [Escherichia coli]|nr:EAL domain-containing protein [Escherichia coli]
MGVYFIVEPIVDIKNNKLVAVEVLSRFYTQSGEQLSTQHTFLRLSFSNEDKYTTATNKIHS